MSIILDDQLGGLGVTSDLGQVFACSQTDFWL